MGFKKFIEFISEKKKSDKKDIQDALPDKPISGYPDKSTKDKIVDATEDYFNAKTPQWNPKGKTRKPKQENEEE